MLQSCVQKKSSWSQPCLSVKPSKGFASKLQLSKADGLMKAKVFIEKPYKASFERLFGSSAFGKLCLCSLYQVSDTKAFWKLKLLEALLVSLKPYMASFVDFFLETDGLPAHHACFWNLFWKVSFL